jgi:diguanylate cyclase (GGDEF)-like protein
MLNNSVVPLYDLHDYFRRARRQVADRIIKHLGGTPPAEARKLAELVFKDPLTKLWNHNGAIEQINTLIDEANRLNFGKPSEQDCFITIAFLDIDDFGQFNKRHGQTTGDRVLTGVAKALHTDLRPGDVAMRLGGEEILVVGITHDETASTTFAHRIVAVVQNTIVEAPDGQKLKVTASVGTTRLHPKSIAKIEGFGPDHAHTIFGMAIEFANQAMKYVKAHGKNGGVYFNFDNNVEPHPLPPQIHLAADRVQAISSP